MKILNNITFEKIIYLSIVLFGSVDLSAHITLLFHARNAQENKIWNDVFFKTMVNQGAISIQQIGHNFRSFAQCDNGPHKPNRSFNIMVNNKCKLLAFDFQLAKSFQSTEFNVVDGKIYVLSFAPCTNGIAIKNTVTQHQMPTISGITRFNEHEKLPEICVNEFNSVNEAQKFVVSSLAIKEKNSATAEQVGSAAAPMNQGSQVIKLQHDFQNMQIHTDKNF